MESFRMTDCIRATKHGETLSDDDIRALIQGVTSGEIPDYQLSAWLMAVCLRGLSDRETASLTAAMRDSGDVLDWGNLRGNIADKHSTGGVGDKTTLVLAPLCAACGLAFPKMSGRGLGHTGGTIDKLESIPGFTTALSPQKFRALTEEVGCAVAAQSGNLAPADKKLYALRDVTETVDSIPLICASIMSKKLATGADFLVLDVKVGSGAFMKTDADAQELSRLMLRAASDAGKRCAAVLTDMDRPLGYAVGNALEVKEALSTLRGGQKGELRQLCVLLAAELLRMSGRYPDFKQAERAAETALDNGEALRRFERMVIGQGGDPRICENPDLLPDAAVKTPLCAWGSGFLSAMNTEEIGRAAVLLRAGRARKGDSIDPAAGIVFRKTLGEAVQKGEEILTLHSASDTLAAAALDLLRRAIVISPSPPAPKPLIHTVLRS